MPCVFQTWGNRMHQTLVTPIPVQSPGLMVMVTFSLKPFFSRLHGAGAGRAEYNTSVSACFLAQGLRKFHGSGQERRH